MNFSIVTYNIWFAKRYLSERMEGLVQILQDLSPTIICLQEVTAVSYQYVVPYLESCGYHTDVNLDEFKKSAICGYGNITLSLIPIVSTKTYPFLKTSMGRYFSVSKLENGIFVLNTHLESLWPHAQVRQKQIQQMLDMTNLMTDVVWAMDSNLSDKKNDCFPSDSPVTDAFLEIGQPEEHRFSYDAERNNNINSKYRSRLDRVYFKSDKFVITDYQLVGTANLPTINIPASDHFGIQVQFSPIEN